jgi:acetate kinase
MKILVLNSGSSSVKFQLMRMEDESLLAKGLVEKIGSSDAIITYLPEGKNRIREIREVLNHSVAIEIVLSIPSTASSGTNARSTASATVSSMAARIFLNRP